MDFQNDVPKHRKKKSQESKSEKRSDHKHDYVKSIYICFDDETTEKVRYAHWAKICSICGRLGHIDMNEDPKLRKAEYRQIHPWIKSHEYLGYEQLIQAFPKVPMYRNNTEVIFGKPVKLR